MVNKIVTNLGRYVVKRIGNKVINKMVEKIDEPFAAFNREILGIKPLNLGEDEEMACYREYPHDNVRCQAIGNEIREEYRRTGKYTPYYRGRK